MPSDPTITMVKINNELNYQSNLFFYEEPNLHPRRLGFQEVGVISSTNRTSVVGLNPLLTASHMEEMMLHVTWQT